MSFEECLYEVNYIIDNIEEEMKTKIPLSIREEIKKQMSKETYMYVIDFEKEGFSDEAIAYLSVLYSEYICSKEEKEKWNKFDKICNDINELPIG